MEGKSALKMTAWEMITKFQDNFSKDFYSGASIRMVAKPRWHGEGSSMGNGGTTLATFIRSSSGARLLHWQTREYMCIHGNTRKYMGMHGHIWAYMGIHGNTWAKREYMCIHGNQWRKKKDFAGA